MGSGAVHSTGKARAWGAAALAREISGRITALPSDTVFSVRRMRREISRELRDAPASAVIAAATLLCRIPRDGLWFVAYELIQSHPGARARLGPRRLERLGRGMDSWGRVDCFSVYLSGPAWREGRIPTALVHRWAASRDRWWRRAALVSTVPLNLRAQGGAGDSRRTLAVCRLLEADRDPMVVKALSWALRALAVRDPAAVRAFIAARSGKLPALALREVRNKLETGLKNPRKGRAR